MDKGKKHLALSVIYDALTGVSMDTEAQVHVRECLQCRSEMRWLDSLWRFGSREQDAEPPEWAISNAVNIFKLKRPDWVKFAREVVATLVYDSFNEPLPSGMRLRDLPIRQTLY